MTSASAFSTIKYYAEHIELDEYQPGNILFLSWHSLQTASKDNSQIIAGKRGVAGDAAGLDARFRWPRGFMQLTQSNVIICDTENHCLKLVDRNNGNTTTIAGQCSAPGYQDGVTARFNFPWTAVLDNQNSCRIFVSENRNCTFRTVNTCGKNKWTVDTFAKSAELDLLRDFIQGINGDIFASANDALYYINYQTQTVSMLVGSQLVGLQESAFNETQESAFNETQLSKPHGLQWVDSDSFLVADLGNDNVYYCNLIEQSLTSLDLFLFNMTGGQLNQPVSFLLTNYSLYLGTYDKILYFQCKLYGMLWILYIYGMCFKHSIRCFNSIPAMHYLPEFQEMVSQTFSICHFL